MTPTALPEMKVKLHKANETIKSIQADLTTAQSQLQEAQQLRRHYQDLNQNKENVIFSQQHEIERLRARLTENGISIGQPGKRWTIRPDAPDPVAVDHTLGWEKMEVPYGMVKAPYDPTSHFIRDDSFHPQESSAFPPKLRKSLMNRSHMDVITNFFLETNKRIELEACYGFYFSTGNWSSTEERLIALAIENFCVQEDITKDEIYYSLNGRKTETRLLSEIARIIIWREKTVILNKLTSLTEPTKFRIAGPTNHSLWTEEEDGILLEALFKSEHKLQVGENPNTQAWNKISIYCKDKSPEFSRVGIQCQKRWQDCLLPRYQNDGYYPQFFRGDWLTLVQKLQANRFRGESVGGFSWNNVKFHHFPAPFLKRCWELFSKFKEGEDYPMFFDRVIQDHINLTPQEMNTKIHGGGHCNHAVLSILEKFPKRKGYKDPPRY